MYKAILFDLDGTLTDSGEGITKSVQYALEKMGRPEADLNKLRCFVGPPLVPQFMSYAGMTEEEARQAVTIYRERYLPIGVFENEVYPGVPEMLSALQAQGYRLAVASSKPNALVHQVLAHFSLESYFEVVLGSDPNDPWSEKADIIEETLRRLNCSKDRRSVIMVGDTHYDVEGAKKAGLDCLAVSYGYDDPELLRKSEPCCTAASPEEVVDFFS